MSYILNKYPYQIRIKHSTALKIQKAIDLLLFVWQYTLFPKVFLTFFLFIHCFSSVLSFLWPLTVSTNIIFHTLSTIRFKTDAIVPNCGRWSIWKPAWTKKGLCEKSHKLFSRQHGAP